MVNTSSESKMRPHEQYEPIVRQRELDGIAFYNKYHTLFDDICCPVCNTEGEFAFKKYGFTHKLCPECGTMFVSPCPNTEQLFDYYTNYPSPKLWTELLLNADYERKVLQHTPRVRTIINHTHGGNALDLGAGSGAFASCLDDSGQFRNVVAVDISQECVNACRERGLTAYRGTISNVGQRSFDLICMNDLIEHVTDLGNLLLEAAAALQRRGILAIATPNGEGFDFKVMKDQIETITPPDHLTYFNPYSMRVLLEQSGFEVISITTPGILDVDIIRKKTNRGFPLQERNEYLNYLMGCDTEVLKNFQKFLADNLLSGHMLAICRKGCV